MSRVSTTGTRIPVGKARSGGLPLAQLWQQILDALRADAIPSLAVMRQLRSVLFSESGDRQMSLEIARLLGERGDEASDLENGWEELKLWMGTLGIVEAEIAKRAGQEPESSSPSIADAKPKADTRTTNDDGAVLQRSAVRFREIAGHVVASTACVAPAEAVKALSPEFKLLRAEIMDLLEKSKTQISKWEARYGKVASAHWREEIEGRVAKLNAELTSAIELREKGYFEDIADAAKILWNRVLKTERQLFANARAESGYRVRLYDYEPEENAKPRRRGRGAGRRQRIRTGVAAKKHEVIAALRSESRGGMQIALRPHQWEMLEAIQEDWAEHEINRDEPWKSGVVVEPTGSGKTRVMGAAIELGLREGWLDIAGCSRVIIFTHLKQIGAQNLMRMRELLDPVFMSVYGRRARVTAVGGGEWDASGDVVVASVPTISRNQEKFRESLKDVSSSFILQDEYHHASAESWQLSVQVVRATVQHGYILGLTATLPRKERASSNIVSDISIRERMRMGILPGVELVQVRTGTSLERIHMRYGAFNPRELSTTVRNQERYEHMMRALEFNGVRGERRRLAPTLIFGVDRAHAHETAYFYQQYFSQEREAYRPEGEETIKSMGLREIAVIGESMSKRDVVSLLEAYRRREPTEYAQYSYGKRNDEKAPRYVEAGRRRSMVDAIVAVITGNTPEAVRELIFEASKRGEVECIINIRALGEGFDGHWIQNLVGAAPMLESENTKMAQRAQEVGRMLRWGADEVDEQGRLLREPRQRVVIDLIDDSSEKRPLATYYDMLGLGELHSREYGARIDVREGTSKGNAYGGLSDVYDVEEDDRARRKHEPIDPAELTIITGEREHILLPECMIGVYAQKLREVLAKGYRGRLAEMSFDLALSEEMFVGYLNGARPDDERMARRMGVLLYTGRKSFVSEYAHDVFGWKPIEEIPEPTRALVAASREKAIELFDGQLPSQGVKTEEGSDSGTLRMSPLHSVLCEGVIEFRGCWTPSKARETFLNTLFLVRRDETGILHSIYRGGEEERLLDRLFRPVLEQYLGWRPIEEIPEPLRALVAVVRERMLELFGGRLSKAGFVTVDGEVRGYLHKGSFQDLLRDGTLEFNSSSTPSYAREVLLKPLFLVRRHETGTLHSISRGGREERLLDQLLRPIIEQKLGWKSIREIPEPMHALVAEARQRAIELFAGQLPVLGFKTAEGHESGVLYKSPLLNFLRDGTMHFNKNWTPLHGREALLNVLFLVRRDELGILHSIPHGGKEEKLLDRLLRPVIEHKLGWKPVEEIQEPIRALVAEIRDRAIELFAGQLPPRLRTAEGGERSFLQNSPLHGLLRNGKIEFRGRGSWTPSNARRALLRTLILVRRDELGILHSIPRGGKEEKMLDRLLRPVIEHKLGWKPIEHISEPMRSLVAAAREKAIELFAGQLPVLGFKTTEGGECVRLSAAPLNRLLRDGVMEFQTSWTPSKAREALLESFFLVRRDEEECFHSIPRGGKEEQHLDRLLQPVIEQHLDWKPLDQIPEPMHALIAATRDKAMQLFVGQLPSYGFITSEGQKSGKLTKSPFQRMLREGTMEFNSSWTPSKARAAFLRTLFLIRRDETGTLHSIPPGGEEERTLDRLLYPVFKEMIGEEKAREVLRTLAEPKKGPGSQGSPAPAAPACTPTAPAAPASPAAPPSSTASSVRHDAVYAASLSGIGLYPMIDSARLVHVPLTIQPTSGVVPSGFMAAGVGTIPPAGMLFPGMMPGIMPLNVSGRFVA